MSRPSQSILNLTSPSAGIDIGNTATNAAFILVPQRCVVDVALAFSNSAQTSNCVVGFDVLSNGSVTANAAGVVTIAASSNAYQVYSNVSGRGLKLNAGDMILINVLDAGDSGEKLFAAVEAVYEPECDSGDSLLTSS